MYNLSFRDLAKMTNFKLGHLHTLVTGSNSMRIDEYVELCRALHLPPLDLLKEAIAYKDRGALPPDDYEKAYIRPPVDKDSLTPEEWDAEAWAESVKDQ